MSVVSKSFAYGPHSVTIETGELARQADAAASGSVRLYDESGSFFGMGVADGAGQVRPRRLFVL